MTNSIFDRLRAPFPPTVVSWRVGSKTADGKKGMALAYIDARDVMERLDEVVGPPGWQCKYSHANGKTVCDVGLKIGGEWIWKADGAGDTDYEAEKGALSDAFKRAAVRWGVGRYLYDLKSPWVEIEKRGNTYTIAHSAYALLTGLLAKHPSPSQAQAMARDATDGSGDDPDLERRARQLYAEMKKAATAITFEALVADSLEFQTKIAEYDGNISASFDKLIAEKREAFKSEKQGKAA